MSRFHLHHRAVKKYSKNRVFLAGDAAHIHTPFGAQGMNTGIQDVTNLAWKIAFVLKKISTSALLKTYQLERQPVGETLVKTTDRAFGLITAQGIKGYIVRNFLLPLLFRYLQKNPRTREKVFLFASQLKISYACNDFVVDRTEHEDPLFSAGPRAGARAPNANLGDTNLFELFRKNFCHLLIFKSDKQSYLASLPQLPADVVSIHELNKTPQNATAFQRYGIDNAGIYFIRPDGYIGFRCYGINLPAVRKYLQRLFPT